MSADVRAKILIWTKAGGCCSYLDCPRRLIMSSMEGSRSLVGEVAHIVSEKPRGPRSEYDLRAEGIDFDDDENLMLLCQAHHKIIDEFPEEYSVAFLRERKRVHEARIESLLTPEEKEDAFNKRMVASNISEFEKMIDIDKWRIRTESIVFNGQPYISKNYHESLSLIPAWIISRVWPENDDYSELEDALSNFKNILCDFLILFNNHARESGEYLLTEKFYQIRDWNPELYRILSNRYSFHVGLVEDLFVELTRALNLISSKVRKLIDRSYRLEQGVALISTGLSMDLTIGSRRVEYRQGELYTTLNDFKTARSTRDFAFSSGLSEEDPIFLATQ